MQVALKLEIGRDWKNLQVFFSKIENLFSSLLSLILNSLNLHKYAV